MRTLNLDMFERTNNEHEESYVMMINSEKIIKIQRVTKLWWVDIIWGNFYHLETNIMTPESAVDLLNELAQNNEIIHEAIDAIMSENLP